MKRIARLVLGAAVLGGLAAPIGAWGEGIDRSFVAAAVASGGYATYGIPGFLIVENFIDGGGPVSQAQLASSGGAESFASLPYPGDTAVKYPGVAAIFLGSAPPGYPLYASASPNQPEQIVGDPAGPFSLEASAAPETARGVARTGTPDGKDATAFVARAESDVRTEGSRVMSRAVSIAQAVAVGPLSVGSVRSESETMYASGEEGPKTATELSVEGGKVGDLAFRFGPHGLAVKDQGVPIPSSQGLSALNAALAPSGMSIRFAEASPVQGGAAAAVFEIVSAADVPGAGKGTLRLRFGGAMSFISLGARQAAAPAQTGDEAGGGGTNYGSVGGEAPSTAAGAVAPTAPVAGWTHPSVSGLGGAGNTAGSDAVTAAAPGFGESGGVLEPVPAQTSRPEAVDQVAAGQAGVVSLASPASHRPAGLGSLADAAGVSLFATGLAVLGVGAFASLAVAAWRRTRRAVQWMA